MFWTVHSVKEAGEYTYTMEHFCPWGRGALEWDGLCSHNPMQEGIDYDELLPREVLEAKAAERKEKRKEYLAQYRAQPELKAKTSSEKNKQRKREYLSRRRPVRQCGWPWPIPTGRGVSASVRRNWESERLPWPWRSLFWPRGAFKGGALLIMGNQPSQPPAQTRVVG
ncbi:hypothetical protein B0I37DRAFT_195600 [Chaetomium sp. MPI-CAGE-AT-0009]|nr:hypothetical protein B0I37DRAFT_195600 [Chaetomium sp. MPI-CAGE-AT-0009]